MTFANSGARWLTAGAVFCSLVLGGPRLADADEASKEIAVPEHARIHYINRSSCPVVVLPGEYAYRGNLYEQLKGGICSAPHSRAFLQFCTGIVLEPGDSRGMNQVVPHGKTALVRAYVKGASTVPVKASDLCNTGADNAGSPGINDIEYHELGKAHIKDDTNLVYIYHGSTYILVQSKGTMGDLKDGNSKELSAKICVATETAPTGTDSKSQQAEELETFPSLDTFDNCVCSHPPSATEVQKGAKPCPGSLNLSVQPNTNIYVLITDKE